MKENFLKNEYLPLIKSLDAQSMRKWGKMNVHQMIEHMAAAFRMGSKRDIYTSILTPDERIQKMQAFVLSDTPFKENTKNILLPDEPLPYTSELIEESIKDLQNEVEYFFTFWNENPEITVRNPFFGDLDYAHWIGLLYKHAWHHLNQFGISNHNQ